jgi:4-hydroxybenzoyl-CoA thioesterase
LTRFSAQRPVRFSDCDPAGIVFFPQYLVMLNGVVEEWFDRALGIPYAGLIGLRRLGLPTVRLEVDFTAISRHGDSLDWEVAVAHLGRSSFTLLHDVRGSDGTRLRARQVLVCTSLASHRPQALPDDVRSAVQAYAGNAGLAGLAAAPRRAP